MLRAQGKSLKRTSQKRTNVHIDTNLVRRISSHTRLKSQRAVVDFALRTTAELLEKRERIAKATESVFGLTRDTDIFPSDYASSIRGKQVPLRP
jgi:Arc/MetJ family transcription regulator